MVFFEAVTPLICVWPAVVKWRGSTWESSNSELSFQASGWESDGYMKRNLICSSVMLISHKFSSHLSFARFWGKTDVPMCVPSTCLFPCRCIVIKSANVSVFLRRAYVCRCALGDSSWTPSQDKAAWENGGYVCSVREGHGKAFKEPVLDLKVFLVCFTGWAEFFFLLIKSQCLACQHGKEKWLDKSSRTPFQM